MQVQAPGHAKTCFADKIDYPFSEGSMRLRKTRQSFIHSSVNTRRACTSGFLLNLDYRFASLYYTFSHLIWLYGL